MRFKTDENLPMEVTERLLQRQHDAISVPEQHRAGQADPLVAQICQSENRALVTCDLDFSDIRAYPPEDYPGIIVLRPAVQTVSSLPRLMSRVLPLLDQEPLDGHIWIVDDHQVRIRGKGPQGSP
jgi:predicted nuclease of predicted toxin-antitoxin system